MATRHMRELILKDLYRAARTRYTQGTDQRACINFIKAQEGLNPHQKANLLAILINTDITAAAAYLSDARDSGYQAALDTIRSTYVNFVTNHPRYSDLFKEKDPDGAFWKKKQEQTIASIPAALQKKGSNGTRISVPAHPVRKSAAYPGQEPSAYRSVMEEATMRPRPTTSLLGATASSSNGHAVGRDGFDLAAAKRFVRIAQRSGDVRFTDQAIKIFFAIAADNGKTAADVAGEFSLKPLVAGILYKKVADELKGAGFEPPAYR